MHISTSIIVQMMQIYARHVNYIEIRHVTDIIIIIFCIGMRIGALLAGASSGGIEFIKIARFPSSEEII